MKILNVERHFLAIMTYGFIDSNINPNRGCLGSQERVLEAVRLIRSGVIPKKGLVAIFPQGYSKKEPQVPIMRNGYAVSLGQSVATYFSSQEGMEDVVTVVKPLSWGTRNDILETQAIIHREYPHVPYALHIITDPDHMYRAMLSCPSFLPDHCTIVCHPVFGHRLTWFERNVREPVGRMRLRMFGY